MARFDDLRGVLDPRMQIRAGAFYSTVINMFQDGWIFERFDRDYGARVGILARNKRSNLVARTLIENHRCIPAAGYLYFPPESVIKMEIFREMNMPQVVLHPMDVGKPMGDPLYGEVEMMIYEANMKKDDEPQELIVMPEDVPELMAKIRKAQEPRAREILANEKKRGDMSELQMKAKILTFSKAS